ncbi:MAG: tyrosine-type recombinase/integrase [Bacteroidales bacterium]
MSDIEKHLEDFRYFLSIERSLSPNTTNGYLRECRRFVEFVNLNYPGITPKDITLQIINKFLDTIVIINKNNFSHKSKNLSKQLNEPTITLTKKTQREDGEEEQLLKATSLTRIIQSLRAFFKYLVLIDAIDKDISQLIITPKLEQKLPIVLDKEEIFKMINHIDANNYIGFRNRLTIKMLYATGLRVSEFINLKLENINVKEEFLDIIGKGNKERYVPIARSVLKDLLIYINEYRNTRPINYKYKDYIFLSHKRGEKMTRQFINKLLNETATAVGITKNIHPHTLRHSFATELIRSGASLIAVKEMMGHASICSTEIYINLKTKDLKETLEKYHPFYNM